jgi:cysteinyl-tRNA synthetase
LRYFLLSTHYHGPLDFSDQALREAKNALNGFYDLFKRLGEPEERSTADEELREVIKRGRVTFQSTMDDDLNTPEAIAGFQSMKGNVNKLLSQGVSTPTRKTVREEFRGLGENFGLFQLDEWQFGPCVVPIGQAKETDEAMPIGVKTSGLADTEIEDLLRERNESRRRKDFQRADEIRKSLATQGIIIEDKPDGTTRWKR